MSYDVSVDLLKVRWLDLKYSTGAELNYTIGVLLEKIRNYDIKKLLIDAHQNVEGVTDEEFVEMNTNFAKLLVSTRLKKVARLGTNNLNRENFIQALAQNTLSGSDTTLQFHNFNDEQSAVQWLITE